MFHQSPVSTDYRHILDSLSGCSCGAANCPWTPQSSGYNSNSTAAAPIGSSTADKKQKSCDNKSWPAGVVRKTEVASPRGGATPGFGSSGAPGRMTPAQEVKPATHVKQEPVSPGASVGAQPNAYSNLKGLPPPGNGKRETQGGCRFYVIK